MLRREMLQARLDDAHCLTDPLRQSGQPVPEVVKGSGCD
jgi:hypothetical protein